MSLANCSFSQTSPTPPKPQSKIPTPENPSKSIAQGYMIDLSQKKVDGQGDKNMARQQSLMSPADLNSMQTTAIDISNRTSAKKIGPADVLGHALRNTPEVKQKNSRNSQKQWLSMTLNNAQLSILKNQKGQGRQELPGPGVYDPRDSLSKDRIRSAVIVKGAERFQELPRQESPGPGNYYRDEYFARNASPISLKGKAKAVQTQVMPGPGAYDPTLLAVKDALRSVNLSSSSRPIDFKVKGNDMPGPGAYDIDKVNVAKITIKGKIPNKIINDIPGPGTYQLPLSINPTVKIVKGEPRFKALSPSDNTGPGLYDFKQKKIGTDGPKFSLGGKTYQKRSDESPGPGQYDGNIAASRSKSPSFRLRGREYYQGEMKLLEQIPGPGAYQPLAPLGTHAPKISLHGKPKSKMVRDVKPGPGAYEAKLDLIKSRIMTPLLSSSQRGLERKKDDSPGPGEYEQHTLLCKNAPQFSMKSRIETNIRELSPGPGQYEPKESYIKETVKTFKFHGTPLAIDNMRRIAQLQSSLQMPGPGAYDQPTTIGKNSPMISIKGRIAQVTKNDGPGPGEHDPLRSLSALRDKSKGARISGISKSTVSLPFQELPGPGHYNPSLQKTSLGFSLLGRLAVPKKDSIPGPGGYEVTTPSKVRFKSPSFDFSKSPQRDRLQKASLDLGPGAYDQINDQVLLSGRSQIAYTFGRPSTREQMHPSSSPGPGAYDLPKTFGIHKKEAPLTRSRSRGAKGAWYINEQE